MLFPIDNLTKKPKGFAFITYMIPENAVTALAHLDGHIFQVFISLFAVYLHIFYHVTRLSVHLLYSLDSQVQLHN